MTEYNYENHLRLLRYMKQQDLLKDPYREIILHILRAKHERGMDLNAQALEILQGTPEKQEALEKILEL